MLAAPPPFILSCTHLPRTLPPYLPSPTCTWRNWSTGDMQWTVHDSCTEIWGRGCWRNVEWWITNVCYREAECYGSWQRVCLVSAPWHYFRVSIILSFLLHKMVTIMESIPHIKCLIQDLACNKHSVCLNCFYFIFNVSFTTNNAHQPKEIYPVSVSLN